MDDFAATWRLTRGRFVEAVQGLTSEQLNWRMLPGSLTLAEMAVHVAGVEVWFSLQLLGIRAEREEERLVRAATEGVVSDASFPFTPDELTAERVEASLEAGRLRAEPLLTNPNPYRDREIKSAIGPTITGNGAFARLAMHPAYHQGQAYLIRIASGFPR